MTQTERHAEKTLPPPTPQQKARAFRFMLVGIGLALAAIWLAKGILDHESKTTLLWIYGRYAAVALLAWVGHSVGLGRGRVVAENLECLAIAVVMALILKHFLIEAYKIPTGSMQPTILGNDESAIFDRVLVNKFAYLVGEPERYDVIVFKYPLDRSKNYIKRLVGLPEERVMIYAGNIYTAERLAGGAFGPYRIARKPRAVRDSVMKSIFRSDAPGAGEEFDRAFSVTSGSAHRDGDDLVLGPECALRYGRGEAIRDRYLDGYEESWQIPAPDHVRRDGTYAVADLAVAADVAPQTGCRELRLVLFANEVEHRAVLGVGSGGLRLESGYRAAGSGDDLLPVAGAPVIVARRDDAALEPGATTHLAFFHVDQELVLEVDGREVLSFAYEIAEQPRGPAEYPLPRGQQNAVELMVRGGSATLERIEVLRDIHYTTEGRSDRLVFDVPADGYFALGDNTQNSSDGRMWAAQRVRLPDGTSVLREKRDHGWENREFQDIFGEIHQTPAGAPLVVERLDDNPFSFVPRKLLLGKALAVFWPVYPHFRWKLIR